jgi:hypothetical protein
MLLPRRTAREPCKGPGIEGVAVQVDVPLNSSADESVSVPVDDPPATITEPFATIDVGRTIALAPTLGEVIVPAGDQVPFDTLGSKRIALLRTCDPFNPPPTRIFPFEFGKTAAKCCSRGGLGIDANVLNAFCTGSNRYTADSVELPLFPATRSTWLFS